MVEQGDEALRPCVATCSSLLPPFSPQSEGRFTKKIIKEQHKIILKICFYQFACTASCYCLSIVFVCFSAYRQWWWNTVMRHSGHALRLACHSNLSTQKNHERTAQNHTKNLLLTVCMHCFLFHVHVCLCFVFCLSAVVVEQGGEAFRPCVATCFSLKPLKRQKKS
jgi:hypothetical protein